MEEMEKEIKEIIEKEEGKDKVFVVFPDPSALFSYQLSLPKPPTKSSPRSSSSPRSPIPNLHHEITTTTTTTSDVDPSSTPSIKPVEHAISNDVMKEDRKEGGYTFIMLDGTWREARKMSKMNCFQDIHKIQLHPASLLYHKSLFTARQKSDVKERVSTLECSSLLLRELSLLSLFPSPFSSSHVLPNIGNDENNNKITDESKAGDEKLIDEKMSEEDKRIWNLFTDHNQNQEAIGQTDNNDDNNDNNNNNNNIINDDNDKGVKKEGVCETLCGNLTIAMNALLNQCHNETKSNAKRSWKKQTSSFSPPSF